MGDLLKTGTDIIKKDIETKQDTFIVQGSGNKEGGELSVGVKKNQWTWTGFVGYVKNTGWFGGSRIEKKL